MEESWRGFRESAQSAVRPAEEAAQQRILRWIGELHGPCDTEWPSIRIDIYARPIAQPTRSVDGEIRRDQARARHPDERPARRDKQHPPAWGWQRPSFFRG